jgi:hypothetical protein
MFLRRVPLCGLALFTGLVLAACGDEDASPVDAGAPVDAGVPDGGPLDAAMDAGADAGEPAADLGVEAGAPDAGSGGVGRVSGRVFEALTLDAVPIAGCTVTVGSGSRAVTGADGSFELTDVPPGARVLVHVEPPGTGAVFSSSDLVVSVAPGGVGRIDARLLRGCRTVLDLSAGERLRPVAPCGTGGALVGVELPVGGVVDATGAPVARVRMDIAAIPTLGGGELVGEAFLAFPGDMSARAATGEEVFLESRGAAEVRLFDDATGAPAQLAAGREAVLRLPAGPSSLEDARVPMWSFDEVEGLWVEEGTAALEVEPGSGALLHRLTVPHFTWWNADQPATRTCITGRALASPGFATALASIATVGVDYAGAAYGETDGEGRFTVFARASSTVELVARFVDAARPASARVVTGAPGVCTDVGELTFDVTQAVGCVRGRAVDLAGAPVEDAGVLAVTSRRTASTRSGADGTFCVPVVGALPSRLFVEGRDASGAPIRGSAFETPPSSEASCGGPSCADAGDITLRADACIAGTYTGLAEPPERNPLAIVGRLGAVYTRPAPDGTYCATVPAGGVYDIVRFQRDGTAAESAERRGVVVPAAAGSCGAPATCVSVDLVAASVGCLRGTALDASGAPVAGAIVRAATVGSARATRTETAADGSFCVAARRDVDSTLEIVRETRTRRDHAFFRTRASGAAAVCGGPDCLDLGPQVLTTQTFATCVRGRLLGGGVPLRVPVEVRAVDDVAIVRPREDGRFCLDGDPGPDGLFRFREPEPGACPSLAGEIPVSVPPLSGVSCAAEADCTDLGDLDFADFCASS